mgnify:FL=1
MDCWYCGGELVWGGDHDLDDDGDYSIVTNLTCYQCSSLVLVYLPHTKDFKQVQRQLTELNSDGSGDEESIGEEVSG